MFLTRVYLTFYIVFVIFRQFPTLHFGLDHSGSRPFINLLCYAIFQGISRKQKGGLGSVAKYDFSGLFY